MPTWPRAPGAQHWRKCWPCWLLVFRCQHGQQSTSSRPDAVGIANNANMVRCLHKLTIVSLCKQRTMLALLAMPTASGRELVDCWPCWHRKTNSQHGQHLRQCCAPGARGHVGIGPYCMVLALLAELSVPTRTHGPYNYLPVYLYSIF